MRSRLLVSRATVHPGIVALMTSAPPSNSSMDSQLGIQSRWISLHRSPSRLLCCRGIDHHWRDDTFATAGAAVDVWDHQRSEPVTSLTWGADTMHSVRFNPVSSKPLWSGCPLGHLAVRWAQCSKHSISTAAAAGDRSVDITRVCLDRAGRARHPGDDRQRPRHSAV